MTSLAFCAATGIIYSCGADAQICEISAATGDTQGKWKAGKHALSAVAVSPGEWASTYSAKQGLRPMSHGLSAHAIFCFAQTGVG